MCRPISVWCLGLDHKGSGEFASHCSVEGSHIDGGVIVSLRLALVRVAFGVNFSNLYCFGPGGPLSAPLVCTAATVYTAVEDVEHLPSLCLSDEPRRARSFLLSFCISGFCMRCFLQYLTDYDFDKLRTTTRRDCRIFFIELPLTEVLLILVLV